MQEIKQNQQTRQASARRRKWNYGRSELRGGEEEEGAGGWGGQTLSVTP